MYQIFCDDYLLHSELDDYRLLDVKLIMEVNTAGSLEFTILPDHPNIFALAKVKPEIKVYKNGAMCWKGRIVEDELSIDNIHKVYCEGKLKALEDTIIRPAIFNGTTSDVFTAYLGAHNSQVSDVQKLNVGTISVTGNPYRDLKNYESTYSRIQDLVASYGGYLFIRYESDGDYLDWVTDFATTSTQQITLGRNILDLNQDVTAQTTYTACIPLGAKLVDENGNETDARLTVESLQGVDYVFNQEKVDEFGWRYAPASETTWEDITTASALLSRANEYLADKVKLSLTLELTALDLAFTDASIDSLNFCEYITVNSEYHGITEDYLLRKVDVDISNPTNTKITLGESILTLTDKTKSAQEIVTFTINELSTALSGAVTDVGNEIAQRERYIRYENGVIEMGETGSDLKMQLSNTELTFLESMNGAETEVAYISNPTGNTGDSKLYIENGEVIQTLDIGNFRFTKRDNGNMTLNYKG